MNVVDDYYSVNKRKCGYEGFGRDDVFSRNFWGAKCP